MRVQDLRLGLDLSAEEYSTQPVLFILSGSVLEDAYTHSAYQSLPLHLDS
jgi:hypothetical protein